MSLQVNLRLAAYPPLVFQFANSSLFSRPSKMDTAIAISQPSQDGFEFWGIPSSVAHGISDDSATDWDDSLDFVASSQPSQDGEDSWYMTSTPPSSDLRASTAYVTPLFSLTNRMEASHCATPLQAAQQDLGALGARRPRLVRRASPVKASPASTLVQSPAPRCFNLVRRVTKGPSKKPSHAEEMEKKRQRARATARRIVKKIRTHATAIARLQRQRQRLCAFVAAGSAEDKENTFWAQ
ncbi:hypothetical protein DFH06DRAFT_1213837 [Mycena polygramma]|nr:hypothetical protein DFH06DRAFT_1213837 [Mycena polygramma]